MGIDRRTGTLVVERDGVRWLPAVAISTSPPRAPRATSRGPAASRGSR